VDAVTLSYGTHPDQQGDLYVPDAPPPASGWPVVVLVHGGFWRERYRRDLMAPLALDLGGRGVAAWNIEYRRVGGAGGWPATLDDVAAAIDHLAVAGAEGLLDLDHVRVVGHSAGGHLALWAAARPRLPGGAPGSHPRVRVTGVVGQAAVADLRAADAAGLSDHAVRGFLGGGPDEVGARWDLTDPIRLVGHRTPVLLVHGGSDDTVPPEQSEAYVAAATRVGDPVELVVLPGDHMSVIDPGGRAWARVVTWLLPPGSGRR
jgi:acetyl esterase/lipase